jgi:hypothetical protein
MTTDWLLKVEHDENFIKCSKYLIYEMGSTSSNKCFLNKVQSGDRLWFVKSNSKGMLFAVATYQSHNKLEIEELNKENSITNEEESDWINGIEIHYTDLYSLIVDQRLTHIRGPATIRKYNEKCKINLIVEYSFICRYREVTFQL